MNILLYYPHNNFHCSASTSDRCTSHILLALTEYADAKKLGEGWGRAQSKARAGGLAPPGRLEGGLDERQLSRESHSSWRNNNSSSSSILRACSLLQDGQTHLCMAPLIPSLRTNASDFPQILSRHTIRQVCRTLLCRTRSLAVHTTVLSKMVVLQIRPTTQITITAASKVLPTLTSKAPPTARIIHTVREVPTRRTTTTTP